MFIHNIIKKISDIVMNNSEGNMSRVMRKPIFCLCENKDADQLRGNREADQRLCFRYTDSIIPLLPKSEISSLQPYSVIAQLGLCRTWSKTPKTHFLASRLILSLSLITGIDSNQSVQQQMLG